MPMEVSAREGIAILGPTMASLWQTTRARLAIERFAELVCHRF